MWVTVTERGLGCCAQPRGVLPPFQSRQINRKRVNRGASPRLDLSCHHLHHQSILHRSYQHVVFVFITRVGAFEFTLDLWLNRCLGSSLILLRARSTGDTSARTGRSRSNRQIEAPFTTTQTPKPLNMFDLTLEISRVVKDVRKALIRAGWWGDFWI